MTQITSLKFGLNGFADSLQGGRPENQDDWGYAETPLGFLLVVCDGMGGGPGGKAASCIAKSVVMQTICNCSPQAPREQSLRLAVTNAQEALESQMDKVPALQGMGTTLVALLVGQQSAMIAHVGDSRCYRIHDGKVAFRTQDHSLVSELVKSKALTEEQARVSPQSNVITRGLGNMSNHVPEIDEVPYCRGDRFVLCTDGVWGIMPHGDLVVRLTNGRQGLSSIVSNLSHEIDQIGFAGGGHHDNHTLAMVEMNMDSILKDKLSMKIKIAFGLLAGLLLVSLFVNVILASKTRDGNPQQDELLNLISEVERLKPYEMRYKDLIERGGSTSALSELTQSLSEENDSLRQCVRQLESERDSAGKRQEAKPAEKPSKEDGQKAAPRKPENTDGAKAGAAEEKPQATLQQVLKELDAMRDASGKDMGKVQQQKNAIRDRIVLLLKRLDAATKNTYKPTTDALRRQLGDGGIALKIDKADKDGIFRSTKAAQNEIEKLKKKVGELKSKMK